MEFPTQEQIVARINERQGDDVFGFEWGEYLRALDFEHAKSFLKDGVTADEWTPDIMNVGDARKVMADYLSFAFDKANNCRGISANRSVMHYIAWTWLAGDADFSKKLAQSMSDDYRYYGKPQLVMVAEHYGLDWRKYDNDDWTNYEGSPGIPADRALQLAA